MNFRVTHGKHNNTKWLTLQHKHCKVALFQQKYQNVPDQTAVGGQHCVIRLDVTYPIRPQPVASTASFVSSSM